MSFLYSLQHLPLALKSMTKKNILLSIDYQAVTFFFFSLVSDVFRQSHSSYKKGTYIVTLPLIFI